MSELKTTHPNDPSAKKTNFVPRSTKTSRAREVFLQKQTTITPSTPSTASTSTAASITPKILKTKTTKATPTLPHLAKNKTGNLKNIVKAIPEVIKEVKNELKSMTQPNQGDVADEDFEIVQINEIKEHQSAVNSPHPSEDTPKTIETPSIVSEQNTPRPVKDESQNQSIEVNVQVVQDKKIDVSEPNNLLVELNPCDSLKQTDTLIIEELEAKLADRERDVGKLEMSLKGAMKELQRVEDSYAIRINELNKKLEESESRLKKSIDECNQHKYWVDSTESQLNAMKHKYFESEQRLLAQEEDLKRLLRWSNIKNASIITCAATAIAYYHVKK